MSRWKSSDDILVDIQETFDGLKKGETPVEEARALGHLLKHATKVVELELEHARMTGRLRDGSVKLPRFTRG